MGHRPSRGFEEVGVLGPQDGHTPWKLSPLPVHGIDAGVTAFLYCYCLVACQARGQAIAGAGTGLSRGFCIPCALLYLTTVCARLWLLHEGMGPSLGCCIQAWVIGIGSVLVSWSTSLGGLVSFKKTYHVCSSLAPLCHVSLLCSVSIVVLVMCNCHSLRSVHFLFPLAHGLVLPPPFHRNLLSRSCFFLVSFVHSSLGGGCMGAPCLCLK